MSVPVSQGHQSQHVRNNTQHLTFHSVLGRIPQELVDRILKAWAGERHVDVDSDFCITYACNTDRAAERFAVLPNILCKEYRRQRQLSWLKDTKAFRSPFAFYMSHYLLSLNPHSKLPPFKSVPTSLQQEIEDRATNPALKIPYQSYSPFPYHGLDKIVLDFDANQYFAFFNVTVPPFHWPALDDDLRTDPHLHGGASFLQNTKELTLHFGDAYKWCNPWYNIEHLVYWQDARLRQNVCDSGLVIDWILEYAWHGEYLQHIPSIKLHGDIQPWVQRKWSDIFARQRLRSEDDLDPFAVHKPDIRAIESLGMTTAPDAFWRHEDHYPPACSCKIGCWRLIKGGIMDEGGADTEWDESEWPDVPVGGWD